MGWVGIFLLRRKTNLRFGIESRIHKILCITLNFSNEFITERRSPSIHPRLIPKVMAYTLPFSLCVGYILAFERTLCKFRDKFTVTILLLFRSIANKLSFFK